MTHDELNIDDRIIVRPTKQTRDMGIGDRTGRIVGKSYKDDVVGNPAVGYAIALDDEDHTYFVLLDEVVPGPKFTRPS